jgi:phage major head subunit gpT-like protein
LYSANPVSFKIQSLVCSQFRTEGSGPITKPKIDLSAAERKKLKKFGQIVRREREKQGLTLYGVEDRGYPFYQHWQMVEKGEKNLTFTTLIKICEVLRKTPAEILADL